MNYQQSDGDNDLLELLKKGDKKSFEVLFHQYHKRVYTYAFRLLSSSYDAEEIVQNVFMALWNQRASLDFVSSINAYIFGIARHAVYRVIRQRVNHEAYAAYALNNNTDYAFITEDEVAYKELEQIYNKLIDQLPERRREILLLSRKYNLSYKEISEKLNITENTVDTQLRLAIGFIKSELKKVFLLLCVAGFGDISSGI